MPSQILLLAMAMSSPGDRQAVEDLYTNLVTADDSATKQAVAREMTERQDEPGPAWDSIDGLPDD